MHPSTQRLIDICSECAAMMVGCVLIVIGLSGMTDGSIHPIDSISFLAVGTSLGAYFDWYYWAALSINGIWLAVYLSARLAAVSALILIFAKWFILQSMG